jgi:hypothetical protein
MSAASPATPMLAVYDGQNCVGFVLSRGRAGSVGPPERKHRARRN